MRVGILSDSHIQSLDEGIVLAQKLLKGPFSEVDAIIHAGDHVHTDLASCFYPVPWYGVRGNMDSPESLLPLKRIVTIDSIRIGVVHGWGASADIENRVLGCFSAIEIDVLVFGHSHRPVCRRVGTTLLFNPGSPTDRRFAPYHTVGVLHIENEVRGEIIRLD